MDEIREALCELSRIGTLLFSANDRESFEIRKWVLQGEGETIEFKETFRLDIRKGKPWSMISDQAIIAIVSFMNLYGGTLLVGVADNGEIVGLEREYNTFRRLDKTPRDQFLRTFSQVVIEKLGAKNYATLVKARIVEVDGVDVLVVNVERSLEPVYFVEKKDGREVHHLYVRVGAGKLSFGVRDAIEHYSYHFLQKDTGSRRKNQRREDD